jgi:hypothetical protein
MKIMERKWDLANISNYTTSSSNILNNYNFYHPIPTSTTISTSDPVKTFAASETVHSVTWFRHHEQIMIAGVAQKYLRIYDLRSSKKIK